MYDQEGVFKLLIELKANVDIQELDGSKWSALHVAVNASQDKFVGLLIEHKANIHATTHDGVTPLYLAARQGRTKIVKALLKAKADTSCKCGPNRLTALEIAIQCLGFNDSVVKLLLLEK